MMSRLYPISVLSPADPQGIADAGPLPRCWRQRPWQHCPSSQRLTRLFTHSSIWRGSGTFQDRLWLLGNTDKLKMQNIQPQHCPPLQCARNPSGSSNHVKEDVLAAITPGDDTLWSHGLPFPLCNVLECFSWSQAQQPPLTDQWTPDEVLPTQSPSFRFANTWKVKNWFLAH